MFKRAGQLIDYLQCRTKYNLSAQSLQLTSKFLKLSNGIVRVYITGKGSQSVLMCPDGPCGIEHYEDIIKILRPHYRLVIFEPPGFGYSKVSFSYRHSLDDGISVIKEILEQTNTPSAILALPCVAGFISLAFAMRYPNKTDGLLAIQTPSWQDYLKWVNTIDPMRLARTPVVGQSAFWLISPFIQKKWYRIAEPDRKNRKQIINTHNTRPIRHCCFCFASTLQSLSGQDPFAGKQLDVPSAILWGSKDITHKKSHPFSIQTYLNNPKKFDLKTAGHFPEMSSPDTYLEALNFINAA